MPHMFQCKTCVSVSYTKVLVYTKINYIVFLYFENIFQFAAPIVPDVNTSHNNVLQRISKRKQPSLPVFDIAASGASLSMSSAVLGSAESRDTTQNSISSVSQSDRGTVRKRAVPVDVHRFDALFAHIF